jgi:hypothetical protein
LIRFHGLKHSADMGFVEVLLLDPLVSDVHESIHVILSYIIEGFSIRCDRGLICPGKPRNKKALTPAEKRLLVDALKEEYRYFSTQLSEKPLISSPFQRPVFLSLLARWRVKNVL